MSLFIIILVKCVANEQFKKKVLICQSDADMYLVSVKETIIIVKVPIS
jgi:hypothetical protein